jgi:hypothetical protein
VAYPCRWENPEPTFRNFEGQRPTDASDEEFGDAFSRSMLSGPLRDVGSGVLALSGKYDERFRCISDQRERVGFEDLVGAAHEFYLT